MARRDTVPPPVVYTVGHSNRTLDDFVAMLVAHGVATLVDVRRIPRSRANPQFNVDALPAPLAAAGLAHVHEGVLGGLRGRPRDAEGPSRNGAWEHPNFRNYADHAESPAFGAALDRLVATAEAAPCAVMCAEAVWWRCHRRIIADYLLVRGVDVRHIMSASRWEPATLSPFAVPQPDGTVRYPALVA